MVIYGWSFWPFLCSQNQRRFGTEGAGGMITLVAWCNCSVELHAEHRLLQGRRVSEHKARALFTR